MARSRSRDVAGPFGRLDWIPVSGTPTQTSSETRTTRSTCTDNPPGRDNPLQILHLYSANCAVSSSNAPDFPRRVLSDFTPSYFRDVGGPTSHLPLPSRPSGGLGPAIAARINPSRPVVDLPVSLIELREIPELVHSLGRDLFTKVAKGNLRYEFGVVPLVSDFFKLLQFTESVQKRFELFKKLQKGAILRKATIWQDSAVTFPGTLVTAQSVLGTMTYRRVTITTTGKIWGYGYVRPSDSFRKEWDDDHIRYAARRVVFGATVDFVTLWELLPWSWLIDWYSDMGDWLLSKRNLIPCTIDTLRVCETTRTEYKYVLENSNVGLLKGQHSCSAYRVDKRRAVASAALPSASLPLISGRQAGILASLFTLRRK